MQVLLFVFFAAQALLPVRFPQTQAGVPVLHEPESYERGKIVERIATMSDPSITYAYYLPSNYDPAKRWPLLYVFDPAKRGPVGAEIFRDAAETYGWIIVSSNDTDSSSDWYPNSRAINAMWPDAQRRFSIEKKRIYATGMSGGAIMAWSLAKVTKGVVGVIGCSGRLADEHDTDDVTFDWFGTAGIADFNYSETRLIESKLAELHKTCRVEIVEGGHRWPPEPTLREAVEWMELQAMRRGIRARDDAFIAKMLERDLGAAAKLDDLNAMRRYDAIVRTFDGLADTSAARKKADELRTSDSVKRAMREEKRGDEFEKSAKQRMVRAVQEFIGNDMEVGPELARAIDLSHLRKQAAGNDYAAAVAQRVLSVTRFQLRTLADDLEQHGRASRAQVIRTIFQQTQLQ
jgi:predicted esterase